MPARLSARRSTFSSCVVGSYMPPSGRGKTNCDGDWAIAASRYGCSSVASGIAQTLSDSTPSVFERARGTTGLTAGTWKVRITAFDVSTPQVVQWAVFKHN
jgi:hypothetical protein